MRYGRYDEILGVVREMYPNSNITMVENKCKHIDDTDRNSELEYNGTKMCTRCMLVTRTTSKSARSIRDWVRAWWRRNVVDEYPYNDVM